MVGIFWVVVGLFWVVVDGGGRWHGFSTVRLVSFFTAMCQARIYFDGIIYMTALFI